MVLFIFRLCIVNDDGVTDDDVAEVVVSIADELDAVAEPNDSEPPPAGNVRPALPDELLHIRMIFDDDDDCSSWAVLNKGF